MDADQRSVSLKQRLKCMWHVLRGRPLVYRCDIEVDETGMMWWQGPDTWFIGNWIDFHEDAPQYSRAIKVKPPV